MWHVFWGVVLFQIIIVYYGPTRANSCIIGFIFTTYLLKIFPEIADLKVFQWNYSRRLTSLKEKLKLVSKVELLVSTLKKKDKQAKNIKGHEKGHINSVVCSTKVNNEGQYDSVKKIPTVVWARILDTLTDPIDVVSCYYTCTLFRNLLGVRVQAEALLILDNYLRKNAKEWNLHKDDILKCRLISVSWKLSVDHFLQHHPFQMNFSGHCIPFTVIDSSTASGTEHVEGLIERLIQSYNHGGNPNNPFPSRHLKIMLASDLSEDDCKIFLTATSILLKYYGKFVWYITLYICIDGKDAVVSLYKTGYNFLAQAQNAKMVNLRFYDKLNRQQTLQGTKEFMDFILSNQFPVMKRLAALKFDNVPDAIVNSAVMVNEQIEKLKVTFADNKGNFRIKFDGSRKDLPEITDLFSSNIGIPHARMLMQT